MVNVAPVHGASPLLSQMRQEKSVSIGIPLFSATVLWRTWARNASHSSWLPHVSHATVDRSTSNMIQSLPAKHLVAGMRKMPSTYFKELFMHIEPRPEMYSEKWLGFLFDLEKALYLCLGCHINRLCRQGSVQLLLVSNYSSPMIFLRFSCFYSLWNWIMIQSQQDIPPWSEDFSHLRISSLNTLFF